MYRDAVVAVVVPAYNEEGLVGGVIDTVPDYVDRIYAVDDRSTDGTWDEIRRHAERANRSWPPATAEGDPVFDRRVVPIRHERNGGVGAALTTGYRRALADDVDAVAVMNGDGQMDPEMLPRLLDPVVEGTADYAKGNRLIHPDHREAMSSWRLFGNVLLSGLTKVASGYWQLSDPQNGYTAVSTRALERLPLEEMYEDYGFCNHLLVRLNAAGCTVADVALPAVYGDEHSDIRYGSFVPSLSWLLLRSFCWRLKTNYVVYGFHPLVLFYGLGVLGTAGGLAVVGTILAAVLVAGGSLLAIAGGLGVGLVAALCGGLSTSAAVLLDVRQNAGLVSRRYDRVDEPAARTPTVGGVHAAVDGTDRAPTSAADDAPDDDAPAGEDAPETGATTVGGSG